MNKRMEILPPANRVKALNKHQLKRIYKAKEIDDVKRSFCYDIIERNRIRTFFSDKKFFFAIRSGKYLKRILVNYVDINVKDGYPVIAIISRNLEIGDVNLRPVLRIRLFKDGLVWVDKEEQGWQSCKGQLVTVSNDFVLGFANL